MRTVECSICKKFFKTRGMNSKYCSKAHQKQCSCGLEFMVLSRNYHRVHNCPKCSRKLSVKKARKTNLERYGKENPMQLEKFRKKGRETSKEKYGKSYYAQTEEYRRQVKKTSQERYGVDHPFQASEVIDKALQTRKERGFEESNKKRRDTTIKRYNVENVSQLEKVKKKIRETNLERYGVEYSFDNPEIAAKRRETWDKNWGEGNYPLQSPEITEARNKALSLSTRISKVNRNFATEIEKSLRVKIEFEKEIDGNYFDLYLPEVDLYIDLNPSITHSSNSSYPCVINGCSLPCSTHSTLRKSYHYDRAVLAEKHGKKLLQIYDWDEGVSRILKSFLEGEWEGASDTVVGGKVEVYNAEFLTEEKLEKILKNYPNHKIEALVNFDKFTGQMSGLERLGFRETGKTGSVKKKWSSKDNFLSRRQRVVFGEFEVTTDSNPELEIYTSGYRRFRYSS